MFVQFQGAGKEYKAKFRDILFNLQDENNPELNFKIASSAISPAKFVKMDSADMASSKLKKERKDIIKYQNDAARSDWARETLTGVTDMFRCGKCKQRKCTYYQMQTRSADEPMTTFVTCIVCNNRWKMG